MVKLQLRLCLLVVLIALAPGMGRGQGTAAVSADAQSTISTSLDVPFKGFDGVDMFGRLVLPKGKRARAIVVYVQTAEGQTVDIRRPFGKGKTLNYYDVYRRELPKKNIGFFSYEGRGIRMGDAPPRYEKIDRAVYDTSTLDNKAKDALSAIETVRAQPGLSEMPVFLMGASEGTLIAAEAASRNPAGVQGLIMYGTIASNMKKNFEYINSDGAFLVARPLDKNGDGTVTNEEWESVIADRNRKISMADKNGDGKFTVDDVRLVNKKLLDAVEKEDFATLDAWAMSDNPAVVTPAHWFKDHFAHEEIWSYLKGLKIPVGIFHGEVDPMASVPAVKALEKKAGEAGLKNTEFRYFEGVGHSLGIEQYWTSGTGNIPAGHQAIFAFIDRIAGRSTGGDAGY